MTDTASGRCLCGNIHYEFSGVPQSIGHCHCQSCRRFSGAAVATYAGVLKTQVTFGKGELKRYESAPGVYWGSCPHCGTSLTYDADWCADEIHFLVGTLDHPEQFKPENHSFYSERIGWVHIDEDLPRESEVLAR